MSPRPISTPRGWVFADPARRTFLALNRAGDAYHYCHPLETDDRRTDPAGLALTPGTLVCECEGGRFRGSCYQVTAAQKLLDTFEAGAAATDQTWFDGRGEWSEAENREAYGK